MTQTAAEFEAALAAYIAGCKKITDAMRQKDCTFTVERLQKRIRVAEGGSVHSFIDLATGDVLKAASWKVPAKHARGNIFDAHTGLRGMGPYGPAYLR